MSSINQDKSMPKWLLWIILILFSSVLTLVLTEILLRFIPGPWTNGFFYVHDELLGTWHLKNFVSDKVETDYSIRDIHFNQFGMRDKDRSIEKLEGITRVAVLGDSFVEGVQVSNEEVLTQKMEEYLGENVEVLNFGVAGFGTFQEYLTYTERVRPFKPDIVVLGFLSANDMRNNSRELETLYEGGKPPDKPFIQKMEDGVWEVIPVPEKSSAQNEVVLYLKKNFVLYRFLWFAKGRIEGIFREVPKENTGEDINVYLEHLFMSPNKEVFRNAWDTTGYLIEELRNEVERDGAKFVLISFPSAIHVDLNPKKTLEKEYGSKLSDEYDVDYPEKHLSELTKRIGISYLDLTPAFRSYSYTHKLTPPYFSYEHDGHWSSLGHAVAGKVISQYLIDNKFVSQ